MLDKILIKSVDRDGTSYESNNFKISLRDHVSGSYNVKSITFSNKIFNIITDYNDTIYFYEDGTSKTATLTEGNYNTMTLPTMLGTVMTTASGGHNTYTCANNVSNNKITVTADTGAFNFEFSNTTASANRLMGFKPEDTSSGMSLTGDYSVDISTYDSLGVRIHESYTNNFETKDGDRGTIYLPFSNEFGSYDIQKTDQVVKFNAPVKTLTISIIDTKNGQPAQLNGSEFEIYLSK